MKTENIAELLSKIKTGPSKWELDNVIWSDRLTDPVRLAEFLSRIQLLLDNKETINMQEQQELDILLELLDELDEYEISDLIERTDDGDRDAFIETLARTSAIQALTGGKIDYETMNTACKLSPTDFILCAKRTQDLINSIQGLVIKGETLSKDVAGA
jgi:hypothetical protein